ncbi:MAG TPA: DEAD/DEAH box helicase family protein [Candidatus Saccharimonadales bacterium]|nr:DEAD/DEAH box helicase family protein [Candidatus Saccharimonadales bacterium]
MREYDLVEYGPSSDRGSASEEFDPDRSDYIYHSSPEDGSTDVEDNQPPSNFVLNPYEFDEVAETPGGGGDTPNPPNEGGPVGYPEDDPEWRGACFKMDVVESIVGPVDLLPLQREDDGAEIYDERRKIVQDVRVAVDVMRNSILKAAEVAHVPVNDQDVNAWKPDAVSTAKLRKDLTPLRHRMNMVSGAVTYIEDQRMEAAAKGIRLRPHQQDVAIGYADFLLHGEPTTPEGGKSGLIVQPTGSGKTRVMVEIVEMVKHMEVAGDSNRVLILTPTVKIQDQTVGVDGKRGFGKFAPHRKIGRYDVEVDPKQKSQSLQTDDTIAMCLPSFLKLFTAGELPRFDKVIVDEVHTAIGTAYAAALGEYCKDKILVGVTATPDFDERRSARNLCKHLIAEMRVPEGIQQGILAPARAWLLDAQPVIEGHLSDDPSLRKAQMREAVMKGRMREAVRIIKKELTRGAAELEGGILAVVRCRPGEDIKDAYELAKMMRGAYYRGPNGPRDLRPIMSAFVGGSAERQSRRDRDETLKYFEQGKLNVVTNVRLLEMGFDVDRVKLWIDLADGNEVDVTQGAGRALRLMVDGDGEIIRGKDGKPIEAHLYSFVNHDRGERQFTVLNVLGVEQSGQGVEHSGRPEAPIPKPRMLRPDRQPTTRPDNELEVRDVVTTVVGSMAVTNELQAELNPAETHKTPINPLAPSGYPNQSGLDEFIDTFGSGMEVPPLEAARILGVSLPTLRNMIWSRYGDHNHIPTLGNVKEMLEDSPLLRAPTLPRSGYTYISPRDLAIRRFARQNRISLSRFTDIDGIVKFYMSNEDLYRLLDMLG